MGSSSSTLKRTNGIRKKEKTKNDDDTDSSSDDDSEEEIVHRNKPGRDDNDQSPRPPTVLKKTLIPDISIFADIDTHAKKAPLHLKSSISDLAAYLCSESKEPMYQVRAFYIWITHNISYDVDEYFGDKEKSPCDSESVLLNGLSICDGYSNVMCSICKEADIPCKVINGYAKGFGVSPDTEFSTKSETDHSWNVVFFKGNWYLIDCTWGAGHIDEDGKFQQKFTDYYFLTNPPDFVTSHFPYLENDLEESKKWQLLTQPITVEEFEKNVKLEEMAFGLKVKPVSHPNGKLEITDETDITLKCSGKIKAEFTTTLYLNESGKYTEKKQQVYTYVVEKKLYIHVVPPLIGKYRLMIYGREASRNTLNKFEKLMDYSINYEPKTESGVQLTPYPVQQVQYGPSWDYKDFGFRSDAKRKPVYCSNTGHILLSYRIKKGVEAITDLEFSDSSVDLSKCTMAYTNKDNVLCVEARLPLVGFYKLSVKAKQLGIDTTTVWSVIDSILECTQAYDNFALFPKYYSKAILENCMALEPLRRDLPSNSVQRFRILAPGQEIVMVEDTKLNSNGDLFEGEVKCPKAGTKLAVYCSKNEHCYLEGIYEYRIV